MATLSGTGLVASNWQKAISRHDNIILTGLQPATTYQRRVLTVCRTLPHSLKSLSYAYGPKFTTSLNLSFANRQANDNRTDVADLTISVSTNPVTNTAIIKIDHATGAVRALLTDLIGLVLW